MRLGDCMWCHVVVIRSGPDCAIGSPHSCCQVKKIDSFGFSLTIGYISPCCFSAVLSLSSLRFHICHLSPWNTCFPPPSCQGLPTKQGDSLGNIVEGTHGCRMHVLKLLIEWYIYIYPSVPRQNYISVQSDFHFQKSIKLISGKLVVRSKLLGEPA